MKRIKTNMLYAYYSTRNSIKSDSYESYQIVVTNNSYFNEVIAVAYYDLGFNHIYKLVTIDATLSDIENIKDDLKDLKSDLENLESVEE